MSHILYLTLEEVLTLHTMSINEFGGSDGIRDVGLVESSVYRAQQIYGGEDLYKTIWDKAAALAHSISENQPFLDGNKRIAALSMMIFLDLNGYELDVEKMFVYQTMIKVTNKELSREHLANWLEKCSKKKKKK